MNTEPCKCGAEDCRRCHPELNPTPNPFDYDGPDWDEIEYPEDEEA